MSGSEEKLLPPTARKLRQARRRGEIARSKEIVTAVVTLTAFAVLFLLVPALFDRFGDALRAAALLEDQPLTTAVQALVPRLVWAGFWVLAPLLVLMVGLAVLTGIVSNGGLVFAAEVVLPKFERLDPVAGFGRLFKLRNLVELAKSALKLAVVLGVCTLLLRDALNALVQQPACGFACLPGVVRAVALPLVIDCCGVFLVLGLLDVAIQRWLFQRDMRMSRSEHKRDRKDEQGSPEMLAQRRQERQEDAKLGARTGLRNATFVIQSRDAALAFRFVRGDTNVPILVARAAGEGVQQLVAEARRKGLPVVFDPDAARAVAGRVQIGRMIPRAAFAPVIGCMKAAGLIG